MGKKWLKKCFVRKINLKCNRFNSVPTDPVSTLCWSACFCCPGEWHLYFTICIIEPLNYRYYYFSGLLLLLSNHNLWLTNHNETKPVKTWCLYPEMISILGRGRVQNFSNQNFCLIWSIFDNKNQSLPDLVWDTLDWRFWKLFGLKLISLPGTKIISRKKSTSLRESRIVLLYFLKEFSLWNKLWFSNAYICSIWRCNPLIFQT